MLWGNLAIFVLLTWPSGTAGNKGRERKKAEKKIGFMYQGEFSTRDRERYTWTVNGGKQFTLKVTCVVMEEGQPVRGYTCEYTAEPALCAAFSSRPDTFWRHISRSLKHNKQHVCRDARKPIKARMCKTAPAGAHFRLVSAATEVTMTTAATRVLEVDPPEDSSTTACTRRADHHELAREKCGSAWASFCNFLFSVVQSRDC